jgi:signal peptidase I
MRDGMPQLYKLVLWLAAFIGIIIGILYFFFVEIIEVGDDGMAPTMTAGDTVLIWKDADLSMGDIVFCDHPRQPGTFIMGRIMARPGQSIQTTRHGNVVVSGSDIDHDYEGNVDFTNLDNQTFQMKHGQIKMGSATHLFFEREHRTPTIPERRITRGFFILGDNRTDPEHDSRAFGEVPVGSCFGQVFMRLSPSGRAPEIFGQGNLDIIY